MWRKAIVLDDDQFDCERLCDLLTAQRIDAEVVMNQEKLESALQWWHPDLLVVNPLVQCMNLSVFLQQYCKKEARVPVVLAGAVVKPALQKWANEYGCEGTYSTLHGLNLFTSYLRGLFDELHVEDDPDSGVGW